MGTILILILIYFVLGIGIELFGADMSKTPFKLDKESIMRIIKWPWVLYS